MFTKIFWQLAGERAIKSFAQSLAAVLTASGLGLFDAPWPKAVSTAGMVALLSLLTSIASTRVGPAGDPSVVEGSTAGQQAPTAQTTSTATAAAA